MKSSRERDEAIERLLRRPAEPTPRADVSESCLDAETLAALIAGGLSAAQLSAAEVHLADCDRCQQLVAALARVDSPAAAPQAAPAPRRWLLWAAPLAAAAAIVGVWVAVPRRVVSAPPAADMVTLERAQRDQQQPTLQEPQPLPQQPTPPQRATVPRQSTSPARSDARAEALKAAPSASADLPIAREAGPARAERKQVEAPPAPAANRFDAVRPFGAAGGTLAKSAAVEIVSPDSTVRWRIAGTDVQRSVDGGATWDTQTTGSADALTAGASSSPMVCWVVGRRGVVLVSTDGRSWRRVPFPEMTDLSAVRAKDAAGATVTTADGRAFTTSDAGASWLPGSPQDF